MTPPDIAAALSMRVPTGTAAASRDGIAAVLKRATERNALTMPMQLGASYCGHVRPQGDGYVFEPAA